MRYLPILVAAALAPAAVKAQAPAERKIDPAAMYEDIEIMRRLLTKELTSGAEGQYHADAVARGLGWLARYQAANESQYLSRMAALGYLNAADASEAEYAKYLGRTGYAATPFEGTYLKGHGVAFTATINPSAAVVLNTPQKSLALLAGCGKCHDSASVKLLVEPPAEPAPKPMSDWDRVRQQLRGAKDEPKSPAARVRVQDICSPGNLTDIFLKAFAENGHNFKQLPASESLTVALSLPGLRARPQRATGEGTSGVTALRNAEEVASLGDLHLKQQKFADASKCFTDAVRRLEQQPLSFAPETSAETVQKTVTEANKLLRSCYAKNAQALLGLGKTAEARDALTKADGAKVISLSTWETKGAAPKGSGDGAIPLPAKLMISVSKKALDDVHAGKIDLEQFKKLAEVQTFNFPPADKEKKK